MPPFHQFLHTLQGCRARGLEVDDSLPPTRFENLEGRVVIGGHNLPPSLVEIGLTDLPISGAPRGQQAYYFPLTKSSLERNLIKL